MRSSAQLSHERSLNVCVLSKAWPNLTCRSSGLDCAESAQRKTASLRTTPVCQVISEYRHITEGLVAQFGPETFGAAWDYEFFFDRAMPLDKKR